MTIIYQIKELLNKIIEKLNKMDTRLKNTYLNNYFEDSDLSKIFKLQSEIVYDDLNEELDNKNITEDDISYKSLIDESPHYSAGIFFLPKGSILPLHDHTELMVFSKVLYGSLNIISYDIIDEKEKNKKFFEVKFQEDKNYVKNDISVLTPSYKNYHQITAIEDSALFDILIPDYGEKECNYFVLSKVKNRLFFKKLNSS